MHCYTLWRWGAPLLPHCCLLGPPPPRPGFAPTPCPPLRLAGSAFEVGTTVAVAVTAGAAEVSDGGHRAVWLGPRVGCELIPPPEAASGARVYPAGKVGSHSSWFSMAVHSPAKSGKCTLEVLPFWSASQLDQQICACQRRSAGIWGRRVESLGIYSSRSVSLADISLPNYLKPYKAL